MHKTILYLFSISMLLLSCKSVKHTEKLTVASKQVDCVGVGPQKCLVIKDATNPNWQFFYTEIEGFNYEAGYEYVIEIKKEKVKHPAADQSSIKYVLVKQISKTKKESADLP